MLRVRVLAAPDHTPIEGADLRVTNDELGMRARTNASGIATLSTDDRGVVFVAVHKDGYLWSEATLVGGVDRTDVVLIPAPILRGLILDASDGTPLQGVRVWVGDLAGGDSFSEPLTTDALGRFVVPGIPIGTRYGIGVAAPGYGNAFQSGIALPKSAEIVIRMGAGARLRGIVRRADGTPAPGAHAMIYPASDRFLETSPRADHLGRDSLRRSARATTDSEGRFLFRGLTAGTYTLQVWGESLASARMDSIVITTEDKAIDLSLAPPTGIGVRVKDARGQPVKQVRLTLTTRDGKLLFGPRIPNFAGSDGTALLGPLKPGGYTLHVNPPDKLPLQLDVQVEAGRLSWVEFVPNPGLTLHGTVADEAGKPLAGIAVHYRVSAGPGVVSHERYCDTDRHGRFRMEGLQSQPGKLSVSDWGERYGDWSRSEVTPGPAVAIILRRTTRVTVRLVPPPASRRIAYTVGTKNSQTSGAALALDADGRFILHGIPSGVPVTIGFDSGDTVPVLRRLPAMADGELRDLGTIALVAGGVFRGRVRGPAGRPYSELRVELSNEEFGFDRATFTDADGKFEFRNLPKGPISITFWIREGSGTGEDIEDWTAKPIHEFSVAR